jgi:hypothetical protein
MKITKSNIRHQQVLLLLSLIIALIILIDKVNLFVQLQ